MKTTRQNLKHLKMVAHQAWLRWKDHRTRSPEERERGIAEMKIHMEATYRLARDFHDALPNELKFYLLFTAPATELAQLYMSFLEGSDLTDDGIRPDSGAGVLAHWAARMAVGVSEQSPFHQRGLRSFVIRRATACKAATDCFIAHLSPFLWQVQKYLRLWKPPLWLVQYLPPLEYHPQIQTTCAPNV